MPILARPLTANAYAPFGAVIMASPRGEPGRPVNQGTARRWDHLASLENLRPEAALNLSVFRCEPRAPGPVPVGLLEKHPGSTQVFLPMTARRYLVIVALGGERPDLSTLSAFVASGAQGISYFPGVWHHPMIALDTQVDFACLVWEDGSEGDCTEVKIPVEENVVIVIPE
ncbi:MAG: ureidoglycolate lyase [Polyangiaceae bacterium]|nr:ureidoglycolate lyase [Polyangiaceae bacterium]